MKVWELEEGKEYQTNLNTRKYRIDNGELRVYDGLNLTWRISDISYNTVLDMDFTEYTPPTDWSKVEVDTKVLVRDYDNSEWIPRHFAIYKNGRIRTWNNGRTSFTSKDKDDHVPYNQAKLYTE